MDYLSDKLKCMSVSVKKNITWLDKISMKDPMFLVFNIKFGILLYF